MPKNWMVGCLQGQLFLKCLSLHARSQGVIRMDRDDMKDVVAV